MTIIHFTITHAHDFSRKNVYVIFYYQTKFHCLIAFTSRDIGLYVSKLIVNQAVMSQNLKLLYLSNQVVT